MKEAWNWLLRNGLRIVAAGALLALSLVLAAYNSEGWMARALPLLAALAVLTEVLAFVMAVIADGAARSRQWLKLAICALLLIGCEAFNAAGSHMRWEADMALRQDGDRKAAQEALDRTRAALQSELAQVNARIDGAASEARGGPQTTAEDRLTWETRTADDRARRTALQGRLDALPVVADVPPPFPPEVVWGFLAFLGFAKCLGLFAVGMTVGASASNVVSFNPGRELVRRRWEKSQAA